MRVLGIDPGTQYLGMGLVERDGGRLVHVRHFLLKPKDYDQLADRLAYLHDGISAVIAEHRPDSVAVESVFYARNARSAIILAHARGVALACAAKAGLQVSEYPPSSVKRAVGANGAAGKDSVSRMVCALLGIQKVERSDCADALAVAICHLNHTPAAYRAAAGSRPSLASRTIVRRS